MERITPREAAAEQGDYIHTVDLTEGHPLALRPLGDEEQLICDPGNGAGYSVREVIETPRHVSGHPMPAVEAPRRERIRRIWWHAR